MGRAVTFFGAADVPHCSGMTRFGASTDVKVGGIGVSRAGDLNTPHVLPCGVGCCGHVAPIATGSTTVFANGCRESEGHQTGLHHFQYFY